MKKPKVGAVLRTEVEYGVHIHEVVTKVIDNDDALTIYTTQYRSYVDANGKKQADEVKRSQRHQKYLALFGPKHNQRLTVKDGRNYIIFNRSSSWGDRSGKRPGIPSAIMVWHKAMNK